MELNECFEICKERQQNFNYDARVNPNLLNRQGPQLLPQIVNVYVDALSSRKIIEGISSQVCILSG